MKLNLHFKLDQVKEDKMDMRFLCGHCSQSLEAPDEMAGTQIACPKCSCQITVPLLRAAPPPPVLPAPPLQQNISIPITETSGLAVASMVIGILAMLGGWFWSGPIMPILAVFFGHVSLSKIRKQSPKLTGKGFAVTGLTLGYVSLLIAIIMGIVVSSALSAVEQSLKQIKHPPAHSRR